MDTLYVRNLNERLGVRKLKAELLGAFERFGAVSAVQARRTLRMKGQAFVSFQHVAHAEAAREALNGQTFLGKPLDIQLAKNSSKIKADGERVAPFSSPDYAKIKSSAKRGSSDFDTSQPKRIKSKGKPNKILFIEGLPESISFERFSSAFSETQGFVEARLVAARKVGFVEFLTVEDATVAAKKPLMFDGESARVSFAKH